MSSTQERGELCCVCKALLAQATAEGIALYCRRCKRTLLLPYGALQDRDTLTRFVAEWRRREARRAR